MNEAIKFCEKFGLPYSDHTKNSHTLFNEVCRAPDFVDFPLISYDRISCAHFFQFQALISDLSDLGRFHIRDNGSQDPILAKVYLYYMVKIMRNPIWETIYSNDMFITLLDSTFLYSYFLDAHGKRRSFKSMINTYLSELSNVKQEFSDSDRAYGKHIDTVRNMERDICNTIYDFFHFIFKIVSHVDCSNLPSKNLVTMSQLSDADRRLICSFVAKFVTDHVNILLQFFPRQIIFQDGRYIFQTIHNKAGSMGALVHALAVVLESQTNLKRCVYCDQAFFPDYKHPKQKTCGEACSKALYDRDKRAKRKLEREAEKDFSNIKKSIISR